MSFHVGRGSFGPYATVEVQHDSGHCWTLATRGATLLSWQIPGRAGLVGLVDGYRSPAELTLQDGVRNGVLAPFPNRVRDGRYEFAGVPHDLAPGASDRLVYHGFLRLLDLSMDRADVDGDTLRLRFLTRELRPGRFPGYPFAVDVTAEYLLTPTALELVVTGRNVGNAAAPYASGWHPYFRLPVGAVDDWTLTIPAAQAIAADDDLIPLPGEAAAVGLEEAPAVDYRGGRPIGPAVIDQAWAGLATDAEGRARTTVTDPAGNGLTVWQEAGLMHVFTGDTLARDRRRSLALEPVEVMTDAFNRADVTLEPGAARAFRCGVQAHLTGG